jgi:hypothetical protein
MEWNTNIKDMYEVANTERLVVSFNNGTWLPHNSPGWPSYLVTGWILLPELPHQPKLVWQRSTKAMPDIWITSTDEDYEKGKNLPKFNWRRKEI